METIHGHQEPSLLIIDDEDAILETLQASLEDEGFTVQTLNDGSKILDTIGTLVPDAILLDIFMPNINGLELLEKIKREYPMQPVIIISGYGTVPMAVDAIKKGARDFIEKPLNLEEVLTKLSFLKEDASTLSSIEHTEAINLNRLDIVGQSELFLEFMTQVRKTAALKIPALIYGLQGTGKSLIAHYLAFCHFQQDKVIKTIDCTQQDNFKEKLMPTDGTIFFKNIQELSNDNQKKALEFIIAHSETTKIIASALPDLFTRMQHGFFNSMLFYKLNSIPLEIVPLNKRRYDIPLLTDHFLSKANTLLAKNALLNTRSIRVLRNHNWIGNITQLKNVIDCAVASTTDHNRVITPEILAPYLPESSIFFAEEQSFTRFNSLDHATAEFEKKYILYLLKKHRYNIEQLGEFLKVPLAELKTKIYKFDLLPKHGPALKSSL